MVKGLERLAGAVGLLRGHTALVRIEGGGVVLGVFGAAAPGEGAVPTILQIHAGLGCVRAYVRGGGVGGQGVAVGCREKKWIQRRRRRGRLGGDEGAS